ncbi:lamin tail domain-containing protein [Planctomycetota bacterium]
MKNTLMRLARIWLVIVALYGGGFSPCTPGEANADDLSEFVADTTFSIDRGFYAGGISVAINETTRVRARVFDGTNWSALNEAVFVQDLSQLVVSEIMYNPLPPTSAEQAARFDNNEDFEFIELLNTSTELLDLTGVRVVDGINFDFIDSDITALPADDRIVLVNDRDAFEFRYGRNVPIAGQYSGKLKNEGEEIRCLDANDQIIFAFTYDSISPWPEAANGEGAALTLLAPYTLPDHSLPTSWTASSILGGTPGE